MFKELKSYGIPLASDVIWSPDNELLALIGQDGGVSIYDKQFTKIQILQTHIEYCRALSWHPNNQYIVTSETMSKDQSNARQRMRVYDVRSGKPLKILHDDLNEFTTAISWNSDGTKIASSLSNGIITVWDWQDLSQSTKLFKHKEYATKMFWGPNDAFLITVSYGGIINIWDWEIKRIIQSIEGSFTTPEIVDYHIAQNCLILPTTSNTVGIWDIQRSRYKFELLKAQSSSGYEYRWSQDGKYIAGQVSTNTLGIWNNIDGNLEHEIIVTDEKIHSAKWHPRSDQIVISASINLLNYSLFEQKTDLHLVNNEFRHLKFNQDGTSLVGISNSGQLQVWHTNNQGNLISKEITGKLEDYGGIYSIDFNESNNTVLIGYESGIINIWDVNLNSLKQINTKLSNTIDFAHWIASNTVALASHSGDILIFNLTNTEVIASLNINSHLTKLMLSEDKQSLLVTTRNPNKLHQFASKSLETIVVQDYEYISAWDIRGVLVAHIITASTDNLKLKIFDNIVNDFVASVNLDQPSGDIVLIEWNLASDLIAFGTDLGELLIFDFKNTRIFELSNMHEFGITKIAWSPRKTIFASGGADNKLVVWDTNLREPIYSTYLSSVVTDLSWSKDGRYLVTSGLDSVITLFEDV